MGKSSKAEGNVTVYPLNTAYIEGVPHVPAEVAVERAAELTAWSPPAFTTDPDHPDRVDLTVPDAVEPITAASEPTEAPAE